MTNAPGNPESICSTGYPRAAPCDLFDESFFLLIGQADSQDEKSAQHRQPEAGVQFNELRCDFRHDPEEESSQENPEDRGDEAAEGEGQNGDDHEDDRNDDGRRHDLLRPLRRATVGHQLDPADPVEKHDHAGLQKSCDNESHETSDVDASGLLLL